MDPRVELGEFLRSRRARLRPEGLEARGVARGSARRRVPGLRREELAQLAGVSVDYYVRMEQGRARNVSEGVLEAVSRALGLDDDEHAHLLDLARPHAGRRRPARPQRVRPALRWLLASTDLPAAMLGRRADVLAWNRPFAALIADLDALPPAERNMARLVFLDEGVAGLYRDWPAKARDLVAFLRMDAGRHPDDPELAALVGDLTVHSREFGRMWASQDVLDKHHGTLDLHHPVVGDLTVDYETLSMSDDPDQWLVSYTADPESPSGAALRLLTALAPSPAAEPVEPVVVVEPVDVGRPGVRREGR